MVMNQPFALPYSLLFLIWLTVPAAGGDAPRFDHYGDPLPKGVIARLGTKRLTLGHARFLAFSPDSSCLAAHNGVEDLRIWDVASGKVLLRLTTPSFARFGTGRQPLVFSPDSKAIALASRRMVRVWEVASGKELHYFGGLKGSDFNLAFSPDGRYLFSGGYDAPLLRWDLTGGGAAKEYSKFYAVAFLALSRDGKTLTADTYDRRDWHKRTFIRWDAATGKEIGRHPFTTAARWFGRLSSEGGFFAAPDVDGKSIALLDPLTGRELNRAHGSDSPAFIPFSADGSAMTCTSRDGTVRVWNTATGKLQTRFKALSTPIDSIALSRDGKRVALTGEADHGVHVWDVAAGRELHSFADHRGGLLTIAFVKDGKEIATASRDVGVPMPIVTWSDWSLRRWDAATGAERAVTRANPNGAVCSTAFSADGRRLATVIHDGTLRLWDVESGKVLRSWKVPTKESTVHWPKKVFKIPTPAITQPAFSADGKTLLAAEGLKIHRWEVATGRELPAFDTKETSPWGYPRCVLAPDGQTLALCRMEDRNTQVILLDAANGKVRQRLDGSRLWAQQPPVFSPDGKTIALEEVGAVSLWEVTSGQSRGRLTDLQTTFGLAFSPGGRFLAVGTRTEAPVSLWDLATGRLVGRLRDDSYWSGSLAFSPDGSRLAVFGCSRSYISTVLVCDVAALCGKKKIAEIAKSVTPAAAEFEGLWAELSGADGARAYRAIRRLGLSGSRGADFMKSRLMGKPLPDELRIVRLIAELDDDEFATREKAFRELGKLGIRAEAALRRTLKGATSAEVRVRVKRLLEALGPSSKQLPALALVRLRAVEALEANGSNEARKVLAELAKDDPDAELKREAKASLTRLH